MWQAPPGLVFCLLGLGFIGVVCGWLRMQNSRASVDSDHRVSVLPHGSGRPVRLDCASWPQLQYGVDHVPSTLEGHRVAYARTRRTSQAFDEFTKTLKHRVAAARLSDAK